MIYQSVEQLRRRPRLRHRGTVYLFVMGSCLLITIAGMSMVVASQISNRRSAQENDATEAEFLANDGMEYAMNQLAANSNWRTTYTSGVETSGVAAGRGTFSFKLVDEVDGNLANVNTDPVRVYGIGRVNRAVKVYSVNCTCTKGLDCLNVGMCVSGLATLTSNSIVGSATITTNGTITANLASLDAANLEASGLITLVGSSGTGTRKTGVIGRTLPTANTVFTYYTAQGTSISWGSIPSGKISGVLLSPANNPFGGGVNAKGIYVINCAGSSLTITNSRIVGTLVLLNAGASTNVQGSVNWVAGTSGYPILLVQGALTLQQTAARLSESTVGANFNPATTPYQGWSNTTNTDTYPSSMNGLVYCSGALTTAGSVTLKGVLLAGGAWNASGTLSLRYDGQYATNPPPAFVGPQASPVSGSWRWEKAP